MFSTLHDLTRQRGSLTLLLAADGDKLRVTVIPASTKGAEEEPALRSPLQITGTPEQLDAEFPAAVQRFSVELRSLEEQVGDTLCVIEAARKAQAEKASKAVAGKKVPAKDFKPSSSTAQGSDGADDDDDADDLVGSAPEAAAASAPTPAPAPPAGASKPEPSIANLFEV